MHNSCSFITADIFLRRNAAKSNFCGRNPNVPVPLSINMRNICILLQYVQQKSVRCLGRQGPEDMSGLQVTVFNNGHQLFVSVLRQAVMEDVYTHTHRQRHTERHSADILLSKLIAAITCVWPEDLLKWCLLYVCLCFQRYYSLWTHFHLLVSLAFLFSTGETHPVYRHNS